MGVGGKGLQNAGSQRCFKFKKKKKLADRDTPARNKTHALLYAKNNLIEILHNVQCKVFLGMCKWG